METAMDCTIDSTIIHPMEHAFLDDYQPYTRVYSRGRVRYSSLLGLFQTDISVQGQAPFDCGIVQF